MTIFGRHHTMFWQPSSHIALYPFDCLRPKAILSFSVSCMHQIFNCNVLETQAVAKFAGNREKLGHKTFLPGRSTFGSLTILGVLVVKRKTLTVAQPLTLTQKLLPCPGAWEGVTVRAWNKVVKSQGSKTFITPKQPFTPHADQLGIAHFWEAVIKPVGLCRFISPSATPRRLN